jgi:hypothetical protein
MLIGETVDVPIDPDNPKRYTVTSVASISRIRPYTSIARYSRIEKHELDCLPDLHRLVGAC